MIQVDRSGDVAGTLRTLAAEALGVDASTLTLEAEFAELGADSLSVVELAMNVEDAFGIEIPPNEYGALRTLGDAVVLVEACLGRLGPRPSRLHASTDLPASHAPTKPDAIAQSAARSASFVRNRGQQVRVVITGIGALTPVGLDAQTTFAALLAGTSGVARTTRAADDCDVRIAAEVKDFHPGPLLGDKLTRRHARFTHLACAAALEAVRDASLETAGYARERIATIMGVGMGGIEHFVAGVDMLRSEGPQRVSPFALTGLIPNMAPAVVARLVRAFGPSFSVSSACASSGHALATSLDLLRAGRVDVVIAGGAEAAVTPIALASFARIGALSRRNHEPTRASRPFDRDRDGFVLGEGAGMLVLETLDAARARGARIYAELAGAGASADAFHDTQPDPEGRGAEAAIRTALDDAGLPPEAIGYVNAHATGTPLGDRSETFAIKRSFGAHAQRLCVGSTKSMTGHLLGASGAVEAIITALVLARGIIPPTINLEHSDPECDLDYIADGARTHSVQAAVSNTFGFGGQNAALVLRKID